MDHFLVHWVDEHKWDVYKGETACKLIPQEMQFEGALGDITWTNGRPYLAKVVKIGDKRTVEKAENQLRKQIENARSELPKKRATKKVPTKGAASHKLVSRVLGERPKLSAEQLRAKKAAADEQRRKAAVQKLEEERQDKELHNSISKPGPSVSRVLNFDKAIMPLSVSTPGVLSDDDLVDDDDDKDSDDDVQLNESIIVRTHDNDDDSDEMMNETEEIDTQKEEIDRQTEEIEDFINPNTVGFLQFLLRKFSSSSPLSSSSQEFAKSITIEGQKMVRLHKKSSLRISKGAKNVLQVDSKSKKRPSCFTRKVLVQLYGKDVLGEITAMGRIKGSTRISDEDLSTIYDFVVEECGPSAKTFTWRNFITAVTKKCSALKSPKSSKKPTGKNSQNSKDESLRSSNDKNKSNLEESVESEEGEDATHNGASKVVTPNGPSTYKSTGNAPPTPSKMQWAVGSQVRAPTPARRAEKPIASPAKFQQSVTVQHIISENGTSYQQLGGEASYYQANNGLQWQQGQQDSTNQGWNGADWQQWHGNGYNQWQHHQWTAPQQH